MQLRLRGQVAALAGDRLIVRLTAPRMTVGGGVVHRPVAAPHSATAGAGGARARCGSTGSRGGPPTAPMTCTAPGRAPADPSPLTPADEAAAAYLAREGRIVRAARDVAFTTEGFAEAQTAVVELASAGTRDHHRLAA